MSKKIKSKLTYVVEGAGFGSAGDEGDERLAVTENYDPAGRLVEVVTYDNRGSEQERTLRQYDSNGRLIAEVIHDKFTGNFDKRTFIHDDVSHTVEEVQYYGDDPGERTTTRSNANGHTLEVTRLNVDGELESRQVFGYDEKGHCILNEEYEGDSLSKRTVTEYGDNGLMSKQLVTFEPSSDDNHTVAFSYLDHSEISQARSADDEIIWRETTTLDDRGNHTETIMEHILDPTQSNRRAQTFDADKLVLLEQFNDSGDLEYRLQFSYADDLPTEEAAFYSAAYRGVAMHVIRRFRYEFYQ